MIIETTVLATFLKDPLTKIFSWTFSEALKGTRNENIENSLKKLSTRITDVAKVKTIYKGDESIDLHEFYVPTRVDNVNQLIEYVSKIDSQSIVLEGTVGQGKSIFMRYLTYQEAKLGKRIPIFFELRRLEEKQSLQDAISKTINNWIPLFSKENFDKVTRSGDLVLFLDGFDEVPHERVTAILNEIESWCEQCPEMQMVISARPESEIQKSNYLKVYKLSRYTNPEQEKLIDKLVSDNEARLVLKASIKESTSEIKGLLKTPLMVTLFVMTYRAILEIPETQSEFYRSLFSILTTRHDKTKPGYKRPLSSNLSEVQLQNLFEEFCFITGNNNKLVIGYAEVIDIINKCIENQSFKASATTVLEDFSKVVCLLLKDGLSYTFIHKSIQEYFYASYIIKKPESAKIKFYSYYSINSRIYFQLPYAIYFLEVEDTYSYYKHLRLKVLKEYIECYKINSLSNTLIENLYILINNDNIEIALDDKGQVESCFFHAPKEIRNISNNIQDLIQKNDADTSGMTFGKYDFQKIIHLYDGCTRIIKIKDYFDKEDLVGLKVQLIEIGNSILNLKSEIEDFISKEDSIEIDLNNF